MSDLPISRKDSGFTIIELLIVIVIIGMLAGLVITQVLGAQQRARDAKILTQCRRLSHFWNHILQLMAPCRRPTR